MTFNQFFSANLAGSFDMLKMTVADMSDADLLTRPVPKANHANWQIGHLIVSDVFFITAAGGKVPELPAGFKERYTKATATLDDAAAFATKDELMALYSRVREAAIAWVNTLTPEQFGAKGPHRLTPTIADVAALLSGHLGMHVGQIQVLRRKLGKPVLF